MKKIIGFIFMIFCVCVSCSLDGLILNPEKVKEYKLNANIDNLPSEYNIDDSEIKLLTFKNDVGNTLYSVYIGDIANIESSKVIFYLSGQRENIDGTWYKLKILSRLRKEGNYALFSFDYSGYGKSEGKSSQERIKNDSIKALDFLISLGAKRENIILYGYSIGSYPACVIAKNKVFSVILESPFLNGNFIVSESVGISSPNNTFPFDFDNLSLIKEVYSPLLWIHSKADRVCSYSGGYKLFEVCPSDKKYSLIVEKASHSGIIDFLGSDVYYSKIKDFLFSL